MMTLPVHQLIDRIANAAPDGGCRCRSRSVSAHALREYPSASPTWYNCGIYLISEASEGAKSD